MDQEMKHPMTVAEEEGWKTGTPRETIVVERIWNKKPDGLTIIQYVSIKSVLEQTLVHQGWLVSQRLHENLAYFKVPHQTWSPEGQS
jgi:hypothetical protein